MEDQELNRTYNGPDSRRSSPASGSEMERRLKRSEDARRSLSDAVDFLQKRERHLRRALILAAQWGISSDAFSAEVSQGLRRWVINDMQGPPPEPPEYYPQNVEAWRGAGPETQTDKENDRKE